MSYVVRHLYTGEVLLLVSGAERPIDALDRYAESQGFPPYSDLISETNDLSPEERAGWVHDRGDGTMTAIFTNHELIAEPLR